jgi:hypothetical protein
MSMHKATHWMLPWALYSVMAAQILVLLLPWGVLRRRLALCLSLSRARLPAC